MRKILTAALAALTFGGAIAATAAPAAARPYGGYHGGWDHGGYGYGNYRHHHDNDAGVAIAAGVVGLALGAALSSNYSHGGYYSSGYARPSYGYPGYYDGYGYYDDDYRVCESRRWVYDPYIGRNVQVRSTYRC